MSLEKPTHLGVTSEPWLVQRAAGVAALVLGVLSFLVVAIVHGAASVPPPQVSLPGLALTAVAAGVSLWRREPKAYPLWLLGLAAALAAVVLGWFLMVAVVVGIAAVLIVILHAVM